MQMLTFCYGVLAVSIIGCVWLAYERSEMRRRRRNCAQHLRRAFFLCRVATEIPRLGSSAPSAAKKRPVESTPQTDMDRWRKHSNHSEERPRGAAKRNSGSGWFCTAQDGS
jgi:hypothetical protein